MWQCKICKQTFEKTNQRHQCTKIATIDEYILNQEEHVRPILIELRQTIKHLIPEAREKMSWKMPTFFYLENIIHFAAFKGYIGIYPGDLSTLPFQNEIAKYKKGKGTLRFYLEDGIDYELIKKIVAYRVLEAARRKK